jgi:hypothetical protein
MLPPVQRFLTIRCSAYFGTPSFQLAFTTAQRAIERLERNGMVQQTSEAKRDRVYCAQPLLDILEEPAHLTPSTGG